MSIVLIALIIGFFAITVFALVSMITLQRQKLKSSSELIAEMDTALNTALEEINTLGTTVQKDLEEKYQSVLFLYGLVEEKQKEIEAFGKHGAAFAEMNETIEKFMAMQKDVPVELTTTIASPIIHFDTPSEIAHTMIESQESMPKSRPAFANPRHEEIWDLREAGVSLPDIAKQLGMGQGEVKLILDLADRT